MVVIYLTLLHFGIKIQIRKVFIITRVILVRKGIIMNQEERISKHRKKYFLRFKPFLLILMLLGITFYLFFDLFNCLIFVFLSTFMYSLFGIIITRSDTFIIMLYIQGVSIAPIGVNLALLNVNFIVIGIIVFIILEILTICYGLKKGI